jgi:UDP-glucose 4-epimerase
MLLAEGHQVSVIHEPGDGSVNKNVVQTFAADITSGEGLSKGFVGADAVIHLAARNHILKESAKDPLAAYRLVNVEGTRNVIRAASDAGAKVFVHLSSVKAMGEGSRKVLSEGSPCAPQSPYGISKLESEEIVGAESGKNGMRAVILRLPMVYGPGNKGNLPRMIRWADRGYPFPMCQPDNIRSMVYVENAVAAILATLKNHSGRLSKYIVKDREDYTTKTIYTAICRELGKKPSFLPIPTAAVRLAEILSEDFRKVTGSFRVSSANIEKDIGFSPLVSFDEGLARTVRWYKRSVQ